MNFIADIGNTAIKIAITDGDTIAVESRFTGFEELCECYLTGTCLFDKSIVASVREVPEGILEAVKRVSRYFHHFTYRSKLPFAVEYDTPGTLGSDRVAAVAGAYNKYGGENVLVIDAGTAITYDILEDGVYRGGSISPGLGIRFRALNSFTGKLPLIEMSDRTAFPAHTTADSINSGVVNGVVFEINEYIRKFEKRNPKGRVVITGGDAGFLINKTEKIIAEEPLLVAEGLNFILEYNYNAESNI